MANPPRKIIKTNITPEESAELFCAWIDYCSTFALIAFAELKGDEDEGYAFDYVDRRRREMYEKRCKEIKEKYESTYSKS